MELRQNGFTEFVGRQKPFALQAQGRIAWLGGCDRIRPGAGRDENGSCRQPNRVWFRCQQTGLSVSLEPNRARSTKLVGFDLDRSPVFDDLDPLIERTFELFRVQSVGGAFD